MKVIRQIDSVGRIVLPIEMRSGWSGGTQVVIEQLKCGTITIKRFRPYCFLCGGNSSLVPVKKNISICKDCVQMLRSL